MTVFDSSGNTIPMVMPNLSTPIPSPLSFLGVNPIASFLSGAQIPRSVSNLQAFARSANGSLQYDPNLNNATVTSNLSPTANAVWSYAAAGSNMVVQSVKVTTSYSTGTDVRTMAFSNVTSFDNATNDAARATTSSTIITPPSPSTGALPTSVPITATVAPYTSNSSTITPTNCTSSTPTFYNFEGPQNIVMQHGLNSNSCAWTRMANWLNQDFRFGTEIIPFTDPSTPLASQGDTLVSDIRSVGGSNYILAGHSQGGLVSRSAAQYFQNNPPNVAEGVVTIDTPNEGANFAVNGELALIAAAAAGAGMYSSGACATIISGGCIFASSLIVGGAGLLTYMVADQQSIADMYPFSNYLSTLNNTPEIFNRAGIIGYTPQRWAVARVVDEKVNGSLWSAESGQTGPEPCNPEDSCGERAIADSVEYYYDALLVATVVDVFVGIFDPAAYALLPYLLEQMFWMDVADFGYNLLIDFPGDGTSDGIVQGPSQVYPGAGAVQYTIEGADSHSAALRSTYDHSALDAILANQFHVPTQASCLFSLPASLYEAPGPTSTTSVSVASSPGCQWSATSQSPWISITSGINGITSGTTNLLIAANPSRASRLGSVTIGNGNSSSIYQILQNGSCVYTLVPGPTVAIPVAGGTSTTDVSTGTDCVWSAVSNTSWLTITGNATGSGSGSFSWTATPNPTSMDRSGSIVVAGQTLVVIDGNPVGAAGTGSVTITGNEGSYSVNTCYPNRPTRLCSEFFPDTGAVSVTIAGDKYTADYSTGSTSSTLAIALANAMNYAASPISATVSGSTISIVATVKGALTNYPVSTSVIAFLTGCNSTGSNCNAQPAFTAAASGSNLSGGID